MPLHLAETTSPHKRITQTTCLLANSSTRQLVVNFLDKRCPRRPSYVQNLRPRTSVPANTRILGIFPQCSVYQHLVLIGRSSPSILSARKVAMLCRRRCRTHSTAPPFTTNGLPVLCQRHRRRAHFGEEWWVGEGIGMRARGKEVGEESGERCSPRSRMRFFVAQNFR